MKVATMKRKTLLAVTVLAVGALLAAPGHRVVGSGVGGNSPYATDAYPGFDGLDDLPKPERREKAWFSWWLSVERETPAEQFAYAKELAERDEVKKACKMCDALVREWPASPEAPQAQLMYAMLLAKYLKDYDEAFEQLDYLLDFYPRACAYADLVEYQYKLANLMLQEKKSFLGMSFTSTRVMRQHYEMIVRRAPGAKYVPEAMLKIADLREQDQQYEEAVLVYAALINRFPASPEAHAAAYLQAKARMWLVRRLAYNLPRCKDTVGYLKMTLKRLPDHEQAAEMQGWLDELKAYMAEDAYVRAKFYDSRQRTAHAAVAAYERFLEEYPESAHVEEVSRRIDELKGVKPAEPMEKKGEQKGE